MSEQFKTAALHWAESAQKTPMRSTLRGTHRLAVTEPGSQTPVKKIPKKLAERIYEQHVLNTPGVAEGFDQANQLIENWEQSL
jgi:hypothetical protein